MQQTTAPSTAATSGPATPCPVAETMRRVQAELRYGLVPSFESLLAFGEPSPR